MRQLKIGKALGDREIKDLWARCKVEENYVDDEELKGIILASSWHCAECECLPTMEHWGEFVDRCSIDEKFFALFCSLKKRDDDQELILFKTAGRSGNSLAFANKKVANMEVFTKEYLTPVLDYHQVLHPGALKIHENIYVPFTKSGIWQYLVVTDCCSCLSNATGLIIDEKGLSEMSNRIVGCGCGSCGIDVQRHKLLPFVYLDEGQKSAYVGYTRVYSVGREMATFAIWKLRWVDGGIAERELVYSHNWTLERMKTPVRLGRTMGETLGADS